MQTFVLFCKFMILIFDYALPYLCSVDLVNIQVIAFILVHATAVQRDAVAVNLTKTKQRKSRPSSVLWLKSWNEVCISMSCRCRFGEHGMRLTYKRHGERSIFVTYYLSS